MKWGKYRHGTLKIDGKKFTKDIVLEEGQIRKRKKKPSREFRDQFGHTPLSSRKRFRGNASGWSSGRAWKAACRSWKACARRPNASAWNLVVCPPGGRPPPSRRAVGNQRHLHSPADVAGP